MTTESKPVKVEPAWGELTKQRVSDDQGNVWMVTEMIQYASELPILDIPMQHLNVDKTIAGIPIMQFVREMKQIMAADLDHPIILDEHGSIFDGRHRAAKALFMGAESIKAKRFEKDPPPTFTEPK